MNTERGKKINQTVQQAGKALNSGNWFFKLKNLIQK